MGANSIKTHIDKVNWSLTGVIIALLLGIFPVYDFYFEDPNITFDIVNDANVLDVHKPLSELNIYFQGEDIQQKNLNLRMISVKIENTGNVDILQNHYDENVIFGLQIDDGHIIESRLVFSNSDYLISNLNLKIVNNTIEFSKPILDKNKYFIVEILVLHDKDKGPRLVPLGKIAGIEKMDVTKSYTERQTFFGDVFSGSSLVQSVRLVVYSILTLIGLVFIATVQGKAEDLMKSRRRHKRTLLVDKLDSFDGELNSENKIIIEKILICLPQNKWRKVVNSLKTSIFGEGNLKHDLKNNSDNFCKKSYEQDFFYKTSHVSSMKGIRQSPVLRAVGSYLYKNERLDKISNQDNSGANIYAKFEVNKQFLNDLESSISFLETI